MLLVPLFFTAEWTRTNASCQTLFERLLRALHVWPERAHAGREVSTLMFTPSRRADRIVARQPAASLKLLSKWVTEFCYNLLLDVAVFNLRASCPVLWIFKHQFKVEAFTLWFFSYRFYKSILYHSATHAVGQWETACRSITITSMRQQHTAACQTPTTKTTADPTR